MSKPVKFVITGQGRCGSNLLKYGLKSHPKIKMEGEYFNARVYPDARNQAGNLRARALFEGVEPDIDAVGFKIFAHHATSKPLKSVWRNLTTKKVHVVHLIRRNHLERLISLYVAQESQAWMANKETEKLHDAITLNHPPQFWLDEIEKDRNVEEALAARFENNDYLRVFYEDLVDDWEKGTKEIQEFLKVETVPLEIQLKKQEKRKKSERLENYDELVEAFRETEHAWMLD